MITKGTVTDVGRFEWSITRVLVIIRAIMVMLKHVTRLTFSFAGYAATHMLKRTFLVIPTITATVCTSGGFTCFHMKFYFFSNSRRIFAKCFPNVSERGPSYQFLLNKCSVSKRTYQDKPVEYYLIRISSRNSHSKHVFEKLGAIPIGTTESTFNTIIKSFKNIMGDTDAGDEVQDRLKKYFDESEDSVEEEIVYEYKLIPKIFCDV